MIPQVPKTFANIAAWVRSASTTINLLVGLEGRIERLEAPELVKLTPTTEPASPSNGWLYYDSGTDKLRLYAAGAWVDLN